jgi:catechol-2,3-dioxygenase
MTKVSGLGHVGLYVKDIKQALWFYHDLLGLQVTDQNPAGTTIFLSAKPDVDHHEILLSQNDELQTSVQQLSFTCESLSELKAFHQRFTENNIRFARVVTHGYALRIYAFDPEGNRVEVYWRTGVKWPQPFGMPIDLTRSDEDILAHVTTGHPVEAAAAP